MKRFISSIVLAIAIICGYLTPAYAGSSPITAKITDISSGSSQVSLEQTPTQKPKTSPVTTAPETQPSKPTKLAKTGTNAEIAATLVIVIAAIGAVVYIISISRKEND